jgi:hypothetical protein
VFRNSKFSNIVSRSVSQSIEHGNYLLVKIHGKTVRALLDTGSGTCLIKSSLARKLKLTMRPIEQGDFSCLFGAEGSKLHISAVADISLNISGLTVVQKCYVVDNLFEQLILGSNFMSDNQVIIDYGNKIVSLCADLVRTQLIKDDGQHFLARVNKTCCM